MALTTKNPTQNRIALIIALFATLLASTEFVFYFIAKFHKEHYDISPWVMFAAMIAFFVAGLIMDPQKAKDAASIVTDSGVRVIGAIMPGGRRSTDTPVIVPAPPTNAAPAVPVGPLDPPPTDHGAKP